MTYLLIIILKQLLYLQLLHLHYNTITIDVKIYNDFEQNYIVNYLQNNNNLSKPLDKFLLDTYKKMNLLLIIC